jgi:hypothetical protein
LERGYCRGDNFGQGLGSGRTPVKRITICAGLIFVLVLAAVAVANIRGFSGKLHRGGTVSFRAKFHQGAAVKVKGSGNPDNPGFAWRKVPLHCRKPTPHDTTASGHFVFPMRVNDNGKFHASGNNGISSAHVRGRFSRDGQRAHGRFRLRGTIDVDTDRGCDTNLRRWHARN